MNTSVQQYRDQLETFVATLNLPMAPQAAGIQQALPSAEARDMGLVMGSGVLAANQGLLDEHLRGVMLCTHLAQLVASDRHAIGSRQWEDEYMATLRSLGWRAVWGTELRQSQMPPNPSLEAVLQTILSKIDCAEASPLVDRVQEGLKKSPRAVAMLSDSSKQYGFQYNAVRSQKGTPHIKLGAVFLRSAEAGRSDGKWWRGADSFEASFGVGVGTRLSLDQFDTMIEVVEPALEKLTRYLWEQIRL